MPNLYHALPRFAAFPRVLSSIIAGLDDADLRYTSNPTDWSILDILCHLLDEETRDFRPRLEATLARAPWDSIDPQSWPALHHYADQAAPETLARFTVQREHSVTWLLSLTNPDWDSTHTHPSLGPIRAGDLMGAWLDHDTLHLRQIAKRLHELAQRDTTPYITTYAGAW